MEKIWLGQYHPKVPATINLNKFANLDEVLQYALKNYPGKTSFSNFGVDISFEELDRLATKFAAFLQQDCGLKKGQHIAIMLPNVMQYPVAIFAAFKLGLVVVNVNPLYTARELELMAVDSKPEAIVVLDKFARTVEEVSNYKFNHVIVTSIADLLGFPKKQLINFYLKYVKKAIKKYHLTNKVDFLQAVTKGDQDLITANITLEDLAFLQYTGGTTGVPKAAMLSHGNMLANLEQAGSWIKPYINVGNETVMTILPMYHIFSLLANCLLFVYLGAKNCLITDPRNLANTVKVWRQEQPSFFTGVNTLFNKLSQYPDFAKLDFSKLKIALAGGMALQSSVAASWQQVTGKHIVEAYGLTEASPAVCINPIDINAYTGFIGLPISSTEVSIRDDDFNQLPLGEVGELFVRGPQVMQGYWQKEEETNKVLKEGWLATGDMAILTDKGFVKIVDRKKDMILVSGFNVYPNEVEDIIASHNKVLEVAVIGQKDQDSGEKVVAYIVAMPNSNLSVQELNLHCQEYLTAYKRPKDFIFKNSLPKTPVGKVLRRDLK